MSHIEFFKTVTEKGSYIVGYLTNGLARELEIIIRNPGDAMLKV